MKMAFHGAARTVTGTKHLLTLKTGSTILLDCGLFQGMGNETDTLNTNWGFDPATVEYCILSHAHIDHSGLLPKLVKDGFSGPVFCTPATRELACILLEDSANIQQMEAKNRVPELFTAGVSGAGPLYSIEDVKAAMALFKEVEYNTWITIDEQVDLMFTDAGHLIGSAAVHLKIQEDGELKTLTFSGDVGRYRNVILKSPMPFPQADYIIMESTYGDKLHDLASGTPDTLLQHIKHTCLQKKGKLIIPAFSVGRTQELLFALNQLELEHRLPELNYFVDSPLSIKATEVVKNYPAYFKDSVQKIMETDSDPFLFKGLKYIRSVEESQMLMNYNEPCVIIAASGMAEAGRVRHHIRSCIESENNTILLVGYCSADTLGGRLAAGAQGVFIMDDNFIVKADVAVIKSLSAHGDYNDLLQFLSCQQPDQVKKLFLVHGEYTVQEQLRQRLLLKGFRDVCIPPLHHEAVLDSVDTVVEIALSA